MARELDVRNVTRSKVTPGRTTALQAAVSRMLSSFSELWLGRRLAKKVS